MYSEAKDYAAIVQNANFISAAGRRIRQELSQLDASALQQSKSNIDKKHKGVAKEQISYNVAMRLEDSKKKSSGDLGEC